MNTPETLISPDLQRFYDICEKHGWSQEKIRESANIVALREGKDWTQNKAMPLYRFVQKEYPIQDVSLALDALEAIANINTAQSYNNIEQAMLENTNLDGNQYIALIQQLERIKAPAITYGAFLRICNISRNIHKPKQEGKTTVYNPLYEMSEGLTAHNENTEVEVLIQDLRKTFACIREALQIPQCTEAEDNTSWQKFTAELQHVATYLITKKNGNVPYDVNVIRFNDNITEEYSDQFSTSNNALITTINSFLKKFDELQGLLILDAKKRLVVFDQNRTFKNKSDQVRYNELTKRKITTYNKEYLKVGLQSILTGNKELEVKKYIHTVRTIKSIRDNTLVHVMSLIVAIGAVSVSYKALTSSRSTDTTPAVAKNDVIPNAPVKNSNTAEPVSAEETVEKEEEMAQFQAMAANLRDSLQKSQAQAPKTEEVAASTEPDPLDDLFAARTGYNPNESSPAQKEKTANATPEQAATTPDSKRLAQNQPATKEPVQEVAKSAANLPGITFSAPAADISAAEVTTTQSAEELPPVASDVDMISSAPKPGTEIADTEHTTSTYEDIFDNEPKTVAERERAEVNKRRYEQLEAAEKAAQAKRVEAEKAKTERLAQNDTGKIKEPTKSAANLPPITLSKPAADISAAEVTTTQSAAELPPVASDADMISPAPKPGAMIIEEAELRELMKNKSSTDTQKDTVQPLIEQNPRIAERLATTTLEPARVEVARTPSKIAEHNILNIQVPEVHISSAVIEKATFEPELPEITDHEPLPRRTFTLPEIKHTVITVPKAKTPDTVTANNPKDSNTTNTAQNATAEKPSIDIENITEEQFMLLSTEEQNKVLEQMRKLPKVKQGK